MSILDNFNKGGLLKGQTSVEFMFLFLIMIIVVNTIIYPSMQRGQESVLEVHRVGQARLAVKQIANAVSEVASISGGGQKTLRLFVDSGVQIYCDSAEDALYYMIPSDMWAFEIYDSEMDFAGCSEGMCTGVEPIFIPMHSDIEIDCRNFFNCEADGTVGAGDDEYRTCTACYEQNTRCIDGDFEKTLNIEITKQYVGEEVLLRLTARSPSLDHYEQ